MKQLIGKTIMSVIRPDGDYLDTDMPQRMIVVFDDYTRLHVNPQSDMHEVGHLELALESPTGSFIA